MSNDSHFHKLFYGEEEPMAKKGQKGGPKSGMLTTDQAIEVIRMWDSHLPNQIAHKLGVSPSQVKSLAKQVNNADPSKCKPKSAKSYKDIANCALAAIKQEQVEEE